MSCLMSARLNMSRAVHHGYWPTAYLLSVVGPRSLRVREGIDQLTADAIPRTHSLLPASSPISTTNMSLSLFFL